MKKSQRSRSPSPLQKISAKSSKPKIAEETKEAKETLKEKDEEEKEDEESDVEDGNVVIDAMKWGMFRPDTSDLVINGRFEDLRRRRMFRELVKTNRCVLMINGYYEWYDPESKNT